MADLKNFLLVHGELIDCYREFIKRFPLIKVKEPETADETRKRKKTEAFEESFKNHLADVLILGGTYPHDRVAEREIFIETLQQIVDTLKLIETSQQDIPSGHMSHLHRFRVGLEWAFEQPYQRHWSHHKTHGELIRHT